MSFAIECRPNNFDEIVGNTNSVQALKSACDSGKLPHTLMFVGKSGCGKTTAMECIKKYLHVDEINLHECDCGTMATMDNIRSFSEILDLAPLGGSSEPVVIVFEEVHRLRTNKRVQESLLYTLEHLKPNQYIIATTTNPEYLLPQFINRFSIYRFAELEKDELLEGLIRPILNKYNFSITRKDAELIYERSKGVPREALQLLYYLYTLPEGQRKLPEDNNINYTENPDCFDVLKELLFIKNNSLETYKEIINKTKQIEMTPEEVRQAWLCMLESYIINPKNTFTFNNACNLVEALKDSCVYGGYSILGKSIWYYIRSR